MAERSNRIQVAVLAKTVYLRPSGFALQSNSLGIPDFLRAMFRAGCNSAVFDLADCAGMDSTFLGVIADAATALPHRRGRTVAVLNAGERATRQLHRVGLLPLVTLRTEPTTLPERIHLREVDFVDVPRTENQRLERVRDLHQQLVDLNSGNRELFGTFVEMLNRELGRGPGRAPEGQP
jgi:anti-sigma B factor antagonist